jgi:hypothetical protein
VPAVRTDSPGLRCALSGSILAAPRFDVQNPFRASPAPAKVGMPLVRHAPAPARARFSPVFRPTKSSAVECGQARAPRADRWQEHRPSVRAQRSSPSTLKSVQTTQSWSRRCRAHRPRPEEMVKRSMAKHPAWPDRALHRARGLSIREGVSSVLRTSTSACGLLTGFAARLRATFLGIDLIVIQHQAQLLLRCWSRYAA